MSEIANPSEEWSLKSQSAALVAEVGAHICFSLAVIISFCFHSICVDYLCYVSMLQIVRREGPDLWQELFPSLTSLSAQGPLQVEYFLISLICSFL